MKIIDLILKIILIIETYLNSIKKKEYEKDKNEIKNDPVDYFNNEYGKLPDDTTKTNLPSSETNGIDSKKD